MHELLEAREVLSASGFPGNDCAPVLDLSGVPQSALIAPGGELFTLDLPLNGATLIDEDNGGNPTGDTLRWLADPDTGSDFPGGDAAITADGVFTWTPPVVTEPTDFFVTIIGIDAGNPALADAATLTLSVIPENTPPDLVDPADITATAGQPITPFTAEANDVDNDNITFAIDDVAIVDGGTTTSVPVADRGNIAIDPTTGEFTWTPPADLIPDGQRTVEIDVTLTATDDGSPEQADAETFRVTLNVENVAPQLDAVDDQTAAIGVEMEVTVSATDSELDTLTFILTGNSPAGATITDNGDRTATVRFTPTADDFANAPGGAILFGVIVTDDGFPALADTEFFSVTEANVDPEITNLGDLTDRTVEAGGFLIQQVTYSDVNAGQTLTPTLGPGTPAGVTLTPSATEPGQATLQWSPTAADAGENTIEIIVTDDGSPVGTTSTSFVVTVEAPPTIAAIADQDALVDTPFSLGVSATDPNAGETFTFSLDQTSLDAGLTIVQTVDAPNATINWTPTTATTQSVTVRTTDSFGLFDEVTFNITVAEATPPTVTNSADLEMLFISPKNSFTFVFSEAMGASALDASNYVLTFNGGPQDGQEIALNSTVTPSVGDTTFELTTDAGDLAPGFYRLTLNSGLADAQGELLVGQTAFVFQVAAS